MGYSLTWLGNGLVLSNGLRQSAPHELPSWVELGLSIISLYGIRASSATVWLLIYVVQASVDSLGVQGHCSGLDSHIGWETDWWSHYMDSGNPLLESKLLRLS